jgi:hypothetical protein
MQIKILKLMRGSILRLKKVERSEVGKITRTGTATNASDTFSACSIGHSCDKNTQDRGGGENTLSIYDGVSELHSPAATEAISGGVQSSRSAVATAHKNSISGCKRSRLASDVMVSHDKM